MALSPGTKLGPYEIVTTLGAGGMGEVYRARDTRLGRDVAIKVLPQHLSSNPDLRTRLEREARSISSLQHPHICVLYDVGHHDGTDFLVMELLEGETLAARLHRGALPLEQLLKIAVEIANALDRAHRQGIVHRDLKPGNIMLTKSGAKLMDFGLAKPAPLGVAVGGPGNAPLLSAARTAEGPSPASPLTTSGSIVGTIQYMPPEQIEGKPADARSDIFAFGAVLYEMATGKRAFEGKSQLSVASAILEKDPEPVSSVQPTSPPALDFVIRTCLAKDPDARFQTAHDVELQLKWIAAGGSQAGMPSPVPIRREVREQIWRGAALLFAVSSIALAVAYFKTKSAEGVHPVTRFAISLPATQALALVDHTALALSPDDKHVVYVSQSSGTSQLYLRSIDRLDALPLPGTDGASSPFFSPDGEWIGFFADGQLKKISVNGGPPVTLAEASENRGGSWGPDDTIVYSPSPPVGLSRVSAAGGQPQLLTTPEAARGERTHRWPEILPGGKAVVFTVGSLTSSDYFLDAALAVLSLDTSKIKILPLKGTNPHYLATGHLLFGSQGGLFAVPFDLRRLEVTGAALPVLEGVALFAGTGAVQYSVSRAGSIVYVPGNPQGASNPLVWVSRDGSTHPLAAPQRPYGEPHLSPDGNRVAVTLRGRNADVWIYDIGRNILTRLTFEGSNSAAVWTPDGKRIAYRCEKSGASNLGICWKPADGSVAEERLTASTYTQLPQSFSPDGEFLAFSQFDPKTQQDIWILPLKGNRQPRPFLKTTFYENHPELSPDGHWLAYESTDTGVSEVYVQAFPGPGGKWQISNGGGEFPRWARNGRELLYYSGSTLMSVNISYRPTFSATAPRRLFEGRPLSLGAGATTLYDIAPDGQHLIMAWGSETGPGSTQVHVVLNWVCFGSA